MKNPICEMLGVEFPLIAFSHCRDVIAAVSKAGGFGVLGATAFSPSALEEELEVDRRPYRRTPLRSRCADSREPLDQGREGRHHPIARRTDPQGHKDFVRNLLARHGIDVEQAPQTERFRESNARSSLQEDQALRLLEVSFRHPIKLIANALGVPPPSMMEMAHKHGVATAALVGAPEHAVRQAKAGVDIIVAEGAEAGGHCGEVSTLVLIPEVLRAIKPIKNIPVLAAGGIMTGRQMAACMAMGAAGVWTGSVWLATTESETTEIFREKMIAARSRDTVRSKCRTGKYSRQLKSAWTEAWEGADSPGPLPMPFQTLISEPALAAAQRAAERGNPKARELVTYFVGQGVGLVDSVKSSRVVVKEFMEEFAEALGDMASMMEG